MFPRNLFNILLLGGFCLLVGACLVLLGSDDSAIDGWTIIRLSLLSVLAIMWLWWFRHGGRAWYYYWAHNTTSGRLFHKFRFSIILYSAGSILMLVSTPNGDFFELGRIGIVVAVALALAQLVCWVWKNVR